MSNYSRRTSWRGNKGFTLIEMAIVLVIIGLILGAVSIGKDLQRNAEYKKIKQKFIDQWAQAYNQYYEKYGVVLGDSQIEPTYAVCGDQLCSTPGLHIALVLNGVNSTTGLTQPGRMCEAASNDVTAGALAVAAGQGTVLHDFFDQAGIRMPPGRAEGREDRYVYLDTNGNPMEIQVCFQWNQATTPSNSGNVMVITGLTPDLARALDQMIDGKPDAREGIFRQQAVTNALGGAVGAAGRVWSHDNTIFNAAADGSVVTPIAADTARLDEDQIIVLTAHYKMNQ